MPDTKLKEKLNNKFAVVGIPKQSITPLLIVLCRQSSLVSTPATEL